MNIFLYIVTIITFLLMLEEQDKAKKDTLCFGFAAELVVLVAYNLLKGGF